MTTNNGSTISKDYKKEMLSGLKGKAEQQKQEEAKVAKEMPKAKEVKTWTNAPVRKNAIVEVANKAELAKFKEVPVTKKATKENTENLFINKHERYTVERIKLVNTSNDESKELNELSDNELTVIFKVVSIDEEVETNVKVGSSYSLSVSSFNKSFTEIGEAYCSCCKNPIGQKEISYLNRMLDNPFLSEEYKEVIRKHDSKICLDCQCNENINLETGYINIYKKEEVLNQSLFCAMKGANLSYKKAYGSNLNSKYARCSHCNEKRIVRINEYLAYKELYKDELEKLGKDEKFLCNHCLSKLLKVDDKTIVEETNVRTFMNKLSEMDSEQLQKEKDKIVSSILNCKNLK